MIPVILEVQFWPGGPKSGRTEEYFCKKVELPFMPRVDMEFNLQLGRDGHDSFCVQWVCWYEDPGQLLVRLELTGGWEFPDETKDTPFEQMGWKKGDYEETFGANAEEHPVQPPKPKEKGHNRDERAIRGN